MGNSNEKRNDDFGKNFNMAEHNRKMGQMSRNYAEHDLNYQREGNRGARCPTQQSYTKLQRKNAIFKPSITINLTQYQLKLSFQYNSQLGCNLSIYAGVNNINQDSTKKNTTQIQSDYKFSQHLEAGTKIQFKKIYPTHDRNLMNKQIIIRLEGDRQATEYSLRKANKTEEHWKIILEKLQKQDKTYELENIYGSGDGQQQCIVCMCEPSNTLVKPCNHMCLCKQCAAGVSARNNKCPICRKNISQLVTLTTN